MKKIIITLLTIQFFIFGSSSAWAQSPIELEENLNVSESAEETQDIDIVVGQDQSVDTDSTAETIEQEQEVIVEKSQEQATLEQEKTNKSDANESDNKSENYEQSDEEMYKSKESYTQEQTVEVIAEEKQKVTEAEKVNANQEQDVTLEYSQSLKVTQTDHQSQHTKIITEQEQSIATDEATDYVEQTLKTTIDTKQEGEINLETNLNKAKQETEVVTTQTHEAETSGAAKIQQAQSIEATAMNEDTSSKNLSIKAEASNGIEIIKEATKTIVKVIQSIAIDGHKVEDFNKEFTLDNDTINHSQEYNHTYEWGTLFVLNQVFVDKTKDQDVYSLLNSIIRLEFFLPKKPVEDDDSYDSDQDGLSDDEENSLGTDPYNPDTDGDGLSDYFEVRISMTNPLNPDTDGNGITDYHEDFDQDGLNNGQEQSKGTNPYIKN